MSSAPFELVNVVVRAGAGAGKTTELTERVLQLAKNFFNKNQRWPHFVVTTFTRKATQELKERLLLKAVEMGDEGLIEFIQRPSHLHISTIHGVLNQFLAQAGSSVGLNPQIKLVANHQAAQRLKKRIRSLCAKDNQFNINLQDLLELMTFKEFLSAINAGIHLYLEKGQVQAYSQVDFIQILQEKNIQLFQSIYELCAQLESCELTASWQNFFDLLQSAKTKAVHFENINVENASEIVNFWRNVNEELPTVRKTKAVGEDIVELKVELQELLQNFTLSSAHPDFWQMHDEACEKFKYCLEMVYNGHIADLLASGELTISDLENISLLLLRTHPEAGGAFAKNWDYWFIDEYQDTSPPQVHILKELIGSSPQFIVGDPQQSIYLFRGARSEIFHQTELHAQKNNHYVIAKMKNYRSEPALLLFFNHLFTKMSTQFMSMEPRDLAPPEVLKVADILLCESEEQAVLQRCAELFEQGVPLENICVLARKNSTLQLISRLAQQNGWPVEMHSSGRFHDKKEIIDALCLLRFLINPFDNKNLLQLLRSPYWKIEDQQIYDWIQLAKDHFWPNICQQTQMVSQNVEKSTEQREQRIDQRTEPRVEQRTDQSIEKSLDQNADCNSEIISKLSLLLQRCNQVGAGVVWFEALQEQKYFHWAQHWDPSGRREANLWKLVLQLRDAEKRQGFSYLQFMREIELEQYEDGGEGEAVPVIEPKKIQLMTIHASKGLQFDHVIVTGMSDRPRAVTADVFIYNELTGRWSLSLPDEELSKTASLSALDILQDFKQRSSDEEERLLYVALTRAKNTVTMVVKDKFISTTWAARMPLVLQEGIYSHDSFSWHVRRSPVSITEDSAQVSVADSLNVDSSNEGIENKSLNFNEIVKRKNSNNVNLMSDSKDLLS
jgi:ATP-dependent helicase/nuclease subunit A